MDLHELTQPRADDAIHVRLLRHVRGIAVLGVGAAAVGLLGAYPPGVAWWLPTVLLLVLSVVIAATYTALSGDGPGRVQGRAAVQAVCVGAATYVTGWGYVLPFAHLFGIADSIDESGSRTGRTTMGWAFLVTAVGQLGAARGLVPIAGIAVDSSHVVAGIELTLLALISRRLLRAAQAREEARRDLVDSEARFRALVEDSQEVVLVVDASLRVRYASPSIQRVLGFDEEEAVDSALLVHVDEGDVARVTSWLAELTSGSLDVEVGGSPRLDPTLPTGLPDDPVTLLLRRRDGSPVEAEATCRDLRDDPAVAGLVLSLRDVGERNRLTAELAHRRNHDELTGLLNRRGFEEQVQRRLRTFERAGDFGVLALQVDRVDVVGEEDGHQVGRAVRRALAERLVGAAGDDWQVARIGDNGFAVLAETPTGGDALSRVGRRLAAAVAKPLDVAGRQVQADVVVGVAQFSSGLDALALLDRADVALRSAAARPSDGGPVVVAYDESLRAELVERHRLQRDLVAAVVEEQWELHYQPLVALGTDEAAPVAGEPRSLGGVEALVRWRHPERGLVPPGVFIPLAESSGAIVPLGWWVLDTAIGQLAAWDAGLGPSRVGYVSVNVSMHQVMTGELAQRVTAALERHGIAPGRVVLELTETAFATDGEAVAAHLRRVASTGVSLAIDDFGTGYSSMSWLKQFPLDILKIDRAFVSRQDGHQPALLRSMVELARQLGLRTVAEGIEDDDELDAVRALGCDVGQGYLLGRPLVADELTAVLDGRRPALRRAG